MGRLSGEGRFGAWAYVRGMGPRIREDNEMGRGRAVLEPPLRGLVD